MSNLKILRKKVLVTGANGLLGQKLVQAFAGDFEVYGINRKQQSCLDLPNYHYRAGDITERSILTELIQNIKPNYIVNSAAYTNVDGCEDDKEECWKVNARGVENLAYAAKKVSAFVVHISTDYVFDGKADEYDETSKPNPLGYYGRAKLAGENALIISDVDYTLVRTMVLYGTGKDLRPNFATWLIAKLKNKEPVTIVDDQFGQPTLVDDLAAAIHKIVELEKTGIFHIVGSEYLNRYEFALKLADVFGFDRQLITPIKTDALNQKAPRPLNSKFNLNKAETELGIQMSNVESGLLKLKRQLTT